LPVTALHSSCSFDISEEIAFPNEVPLKPPFHLFFQTSDWCKTTFDPEIVSFSVRLGRNRNFFLSSASLTQHLNELLTVLSFVAEPCNQMLRSELQLFPNANPGIRMIRFGVHLSTFFLFHSFNRLEVRLVRGLLLGPNNSSCCFPLFGAAVLPVTRAYQGTATHFAGHPASFQHSGPVACIETASQPKPGADSTD
jgi:hypothetical protein